MVKLSTNFANEKKLTVPQVKKLLDDIGEENLNQFQHRTLNYASKFSRVKAETAETILEKLKSNFDLDETEAIQIINCMPKNVQELRVFLSSGRKIIGALKLEAIINLLNEYQVTDK